MIHSFNLVTNKCLLDSTIKYEKEGKSYFQMYEVDRDRKKEIYKNDIINDVIIKLKLKNRIESDCIFRVK